jgi:small subunit ribosomal protein S6
MALYEHVFIARQDVSSAQVEGLIEEFTKIVESGGGSVKTHEYWGLKTMAYRIKKNRKGHYVMMNIDADPAAVNELERNERLHEDVLRNLTLRVDAFEDGPSVMMQNKREGDRRGPRSDRRDDRDDRGGRFGDRSAGAAAGGEAAKPSGDAAPSGDAKPSADEAVPAVKAEEPAETDKVEAAATESEASEAESASAEGEDSKKEDA